MNYNALVQPLKNKLEDYCNRTLGDKKDKHHYICPFCGSGTGAKGTPAFSLFPSDSKEKYQCFSCNAKGDIVDLYMHIENESNNVTALKALYDYYGMDYPEEKHTEEKHIEEETEYVENPWICATPESVLESCEAGEEFYNYAHKNIEKTNYWKKRGLTREIVDRFNIGYIEGWISPKARNKRGKYSNPYLIIPTSEHSYLARYTGKEEHIEEKYGKMKVGLLHFLNVEALKSNEPLFIVEGEIDCLSVVQCGYNAIALGSTTNVGKLVEEMKLQGCDASRIIPLLDNDKAGKKATDLLLQECKKVGYPVIEAGYDATGYNALGNYKDPNDFLVKDPEGLKKLLEYLATATPEELQAKKEKDKQEEYKKHSNKHYLEAFLNQVRESVNTTAIPTGFNSLDYYLDGGLYEGLYVIGAISSLGKTTLVLQMADYIAKSGTDVIIFSLEMARNEIIAKSLSRETFQICIDEGINAEYAKTVRDITNYDRWKKYSDVETNLIIKAMEQYSMYADKVYIYEGIGDIGALHIKSVVENHITVTGRKPVIIVDYLQILAPYNDKATDKQNTDKSVLELKRLSRDYKIPVLAISSFNRANYTNFVTMEAFKESGAIEYSSDVLIGMQIAGTGSPLSNKFGKEMDIAKEKAKSERNIEIVILKNRNGRISNPLPFTYFTRHNYYRDARKRG